MGSRLLYIIADAESSRPMQGAHDDLDLILGLSKDVPAKLLNRRPRSPEPVEGLDKVRVRA
jgi:hypothetical protein